MGACEIFALSFFAFMMFILLPAAALDILGEKGRAALWAELSEKLFKGSDSK